MNRASGSGNSQPLAHKASLPEPRRASSSFTADSWQLAFFDAVLETNRGRALPLIVRAQSILEQRMSELASDPSDCPAEALDLLNSLTYLGILLDCTSTDLGGLLWD